MAAKKQQTYECGICGRRSPADQMFHSKHGKRYHPVGKCKKPTVRRQREIKDSFPSLRSRGLELLEHYAEAA